uniref:Rad21/Rec8-like protein C-terminal eukaryotic domain-containing protein n=1 Tax=Meloidogyne javanica TaxID=6303 RepID=A0A915MN31_MELJA
MCKLEKRKNVPLLFEVKMGVIQEKLVGQEFVCFHQAAKVNELGKGEIGRKRAARKFFTLLKLLKHRKVKVLQYNPYEEILIRLERQPGDLDVSMASM